MVKKRCGKCKCLKRLTMFYLNRAKPDGRQPYCKKCVKDDYTERAAADPKYFARLAKRSREKDPERTERNRRKRRAKAYGLTLEQLTALETAADGRCMICRTPVAKLVVDHCHKTGRVRGLLCGTCNSAIGYLKDDPEIIRRAADYVS